MTTPTGPYANRERDGWSTLTAIAKTICRISNAFDPILRSKWSGSPNVIALLDAIAAICPLLPAAMADVVGTYTSGSNENIDNDGGQLYGGRLPDAEPPI